LLIQATGRRAPPNAQEAAANALPEHPLLGLRLFVMRFDSEGGCRELTDWFIERQSPSGELRHPLRREVQRNR
jgi:hypothetical protein